MPNAGEIEHKNYNRGGALFRPKRKRAKTRQIAKLTAIPANSKKTHKHSKNARIFNVAQRQNSPGTGLFIRILKWAIVKCR